MLKFKKWVNKTIIKLVNDERGQSHLLEIIGGLAIVAFVLVTVFPDLTSALTTSLRKLINNVVNLY